MKVRSKSIFNIFTLVALLISMLGSTVFVTPVYAAGIVVNSSADTVSDDGTCTLREAITNANGDSQIHATAGECATGVGSDTITFAANYTITLGSQLPAVVTTIAINGNGVANTIVQADANPNIAAYRVFEVSNVGNLTLDNLTVQNGRCNGSCTTTTSSGGGIFNQGVLTVTNSAISGNSASNTGGGIFNNTFSTLTVTNSTFRDNVASAGGGITNSGTLSVTNSTFLGNSSATEGGGILNQGPLTVTNSTFSNNTAVTWGGGIDNKHILTVTNSTFLGNSADFGGGIFNKVGSLTLANSTFSGNSALFGGGIDNVDNSTATVTNSTFSGNTATFGSGGSGIDNSNNGQDTTSTITLKNTIVANSVSGANCSGTIVANSFNLDTDDSCGNATQKTSAQINLGSLADNSGPTQTFALLIGSSAIDAGDSTVCATSIGDPNYGAGGLDQRGVARPQGTGCDIGAFEAVTIFSDVSLNYWANGFIERLYNAGITGGCSVTPLNYCPENTVTRAQMAIFLLKGIHGSSYSPPPVGTGTGFGDVANNYWAAAWIKQLAAEGITGGCGNGNYCPDATVTRAQMAIFLLKAKHGSAYAPPPATGVFTDVPAGYWARNWIEQLASEGITSGCGIGVYCPDAGVSRAQMAVFLVKTFNLP